MVLQGERLSLKKKVMLWNKQLRRSDVITVEPVYKDRGYNGNTNIAIEVLVPTQASHWNLCLKCPSKRIACKVP